MTDQVTPFDTNAPAAPVAPVAPVVADLVPAPAAPAVVVPDSVLDMIGDGRKYSSTEEALKSIPFANDHIDKLQDENASLREQVQKAKALEEVLAELKSDNEVSKIPLVPTPAPQVDTDTLDALIDQALVAKETKASEVANTNEVVDKFIEVFGDKDNAMKEYLQKAQDLGLSVPYLNSLAATSPKAVFELCGLNPREGAPVPRVTSNINTGAVQPVVTDTQPQSVMGRSTYTDDINAWKAAAPQS